jgi:hypothetical protein
MPETHLSEEQLVLQYYGEPQDQPGIEEHLAACPRCRAALDELRQILSLVDAEQPPDPLDGLEQRVWARLEPEVRGNGQWWKRLIPVIPRWAYAAGAAAALVLAFLAGRYTGPVPTPLPGESVVADTSTQAERLMTVAVGEHLDQSQVMLLELLNADLDGVASIESERQRARDLVAANRLYRQTALQAGNEGIGELLDALERVLVEIANAPPDVSARELDALRADIEQRGILFRLRVMSSEMRAREQNVVGTAPAGP